MDALPVQEPAGLPSASTAVAPYHGTKVPVLLARGHDAYTAMLMATASAPNIAGLQIVVSRKARLTDSPMVVTIGTINGGTGPGIVPEMVHANGTIYAYHE